MEAVPSSAHVMSDQIKSDNFKINCNLLKINKLKMTDKVDFSILKQLAV